MLVIAWVCLERVTLGYHSIGQVTTGVAIAIALHFYSVLLPQWTVLVDSVVQLVCMVALFVDPALVFGPDDMSTRAAAVSVFTCRFLSLSSCYSQFAVRALSDLSFYSYFVS